ncbi:MAG TPA: hypothetical protein VEU06_08425 [Micropepsaceae bacterium]|nr:hypothetical protein [Micropepsaceae bacterium]
MKASRILSIVVLSAAFATPAFANYFSNPNLGMSANVGSAPNPTPADLRADHNLPHIAVVRGRAQPHLVQVATSLPRLYSTDASENAPRMSAAMTKPDSDGSGGFFSWLWDWTTPAPKMSAPAPAPMMRAPAPMMSDDSNSGGFFSGLFDWLPL